MLCIHLISTSSQNLKTSDNSPVLMDHFTLKWTLPAILPTGSGYL